ncbi:hypothetical protein DFP73DRAFT_347188 [Morchella snyderi]|nr:hypothetical protein DFP73DRAFT_347188 [Morchella snyderi]
MSTSTTETGFFKPQEKNVDGLPVRLILCFDGTGDTMKGSFSAMRGKISGQKDSIKAIFDMSKSGPVSDSGGQRTFQFVQYFEGIGTKDAGYGDYLDRAVSLFDCATGHGYLDILQNGYKVCCKQLQHGNARRHEIFIFGFSRGAFISRALASFIQYVGLMKEEFLNEDEIFRAKFNELLHQYTSITKWSIIGAKKSIKNRDLKLLPFCFQSPRVRLLGAFDTVKTVIPLPVTNYLSHGVSNIDFEMDAPGIVDHFRHALALNEARPLFNPDLWKSEADSADSSYLEAWFFGYHHDIGGGRKVGGLALWPLQWILQAAKDHGLVLDPEVQPYDVLFTGEDNVIQTPHDIAMKMFDMIKHHTATRAWGLSLNMPGSYTSSEPRNYLQYLTMPPYLTILKPKVFLHPSAYLVFDISSSFRLQVYQWKYFRNFLRDRFITLSQDKAPWWEKQTVNGILEGGAREVQHLNLLVIGRPGMGKSELIGKVFGKVQKTKHDIDTPIIIPDNDRVRIYHSSGFGEGGSDDRARIEAFLEQHRNTADVREQIHAMWYFLDCSQKKVPQSEKDFFEMNFGNL